MPKYLHIISNVSMLLLVVAGVTAGLLLNTNPAHAQSVYCVWNGHSYKPGEYFYNNSGQLYLCESNGSITYAGITYGNPPPEPYLYNPNLIVNTYNQSAAYAAQTLPVYPGVQTAAYPAYASAYTAYPAYPTYSTYSPYPPAPYYNCAYGGVTYSPGQIIYNPTLHQFFYCNTDGSVSAYTPAAGAYSYPSGSPGYYTYPYGGYIPPY